jgi:hypothetical protein
MPVVTAPPAATHQPPSTTPPESRYGQLVRRVQSEYLEMPGLCLTFDQACRLWALDSQTCSRVLQDLVAEGFVAVSERGIYGRPTTT